MADHAYRLPAAATILQARQACGELEALLAAAVPGDRVTVDPDGMETIDSAFGQVLAAFLKGAGARGVLVTIPGCDPASLFREAFASDFGGQELESLRNFLARAGSEARDE